MYFKVSHKKCLLLYLYEALNFLSRCGKQPLSLKDNVSFRSRGSKLALSLCFRHFLALNSADLRDLIDFMEYLCYEPDNYTSATLSQK